jgi:hypothetical protein
MHILIADDLYYQAVKNEQAYKEQRLPRISEQALLLF